jgi:hypothetical protein
MDPARSQEAISLFGVLFCTCGERVGIGHESAVQTGKQRWLVSSSIRHPSMRKSYN